MSQPQHPQPQQPSWANPQQQPNGAPPFQPQPQPPTKRKVGKILGFGCLGVFGLFILLGAIGAALGGSKSTNSSAATSPTPTKASASPSTAAKTTTPAKAKAPAKTAAPAKATAAKQPAKKPDTAQARKKAAAILEKEDQDFRDFLAQGVKVTGTPDFTAWYQKAIVGLDMQQNAFKKADAYFTADTEPTDLLEAWRSDNGDGNSRITQYAMDGTSPDAPDASTQRDAADCLAALAKADKDAEKIANGS